MLLGLFKNSLIKPQPFLIWRNIEWDAAKNKEKMNKNLLWYKTKRKFFQRVETTRKNNVFFC